MISDVTLTKGLLTIDGWVIDEVTVTTEGQLDITPMAAGRSDTTLVLDFEGRKRTFTLHGHLVDGNQLYSTFPGTSALAGQYQSIEDNFADPLPPNTSMVFISTMTATVNVWFNSWRPKWKGGETDRITFTMVLTEGAA